MGDWSLGRKVAKSALYGRMQDRALRYVRNPDRLSALVRKAKSKANRRRVPLGNALDSLFTFLRLIRAYSNKEYVDVSKRTLALVLGTVLYFIFPMDMIPDVLIGFGLIDDAALIGWTVHSLKTELEKFREWESARTGEEE